MPTAEQLKLRRDRIVEQVELLRRSEVTVEQIPYNLKVAVLAAALAAGIITPDVVPDKIAQDVALSFLKDEHNRTRDNAADSGTDVHGVIDRICCGEIVEVPLELERHIAAWRQFVDDYQMIFVRTEFSVYNAKDTYAGTGDFLGYSNRYPKWGLICGDYKTSRSGIWPDIALQLAAIKYAEFIGEEDLSRNHDLLPQIKTCIGVQITAEGYQVVPTRVTDGTFKVFLAACVVARWKREFESLALDKSLGFIPLREDSHV